MVARGEVWWVNFGQPVGAGPEYHRPSVIISSDRFNRSRISTVLVAAVTSNLRLADAPGNVALATTDASLPKPSVINVSQLLAIDRTLLESRAGRVPAIRLQELDKGLRLVLGL